MTPQDLADIMERHVESPSSPPDLAHVCLTCWQDWPCDAVRLLVLLRETREALAELHGAAQAFRGNKPYRESDPTEEPLLDGLMKGSAALAALASLGAEP